MSYLNIMIDSLDWLWIGRTWRDLTGDVLSILYTVNV